MPSHLTSHFASGESLGMLRRLSSCRPLVCAALARACRGLGSRTSSATAERHSVSERASSAALRPRPSMPITGRSPAARACIAQLRAIAAPRALVKQVTRMPPDASASARRAVAASSMVGMTSCVDILGMCNSE